ncbi:hypothetical protein PAPYR_13185 [Paratrimastix pyriformis]|uniref:Uncharacterized protein n=1 Tax=Paratrimastix pyriformis TaxID=342808 RepID=A0ABQ8U276_9EUKA|nr:hypothetical protein PAPYR_13185 [Paratrimastix pyriformis]
MAWVPAPTCAYLPQAVRFVPVTRLTHSSTETLEWLKPSGAVTFNPQRKSADNLVPVRPADRATLALMPMPNSCAVGCPDVIVPFTIFLDETRKHDGHKTGGLQTSFMGLPSLPKDQRHSPSANYMMGVTDKEDAMAFARRLVHVCARVNPFTLVLEGRQIKVQPVLFGWKGDGHALPMGIPLMATRSKKETKMLGEAAKETDQAKRPRLEPDLPEPVPEPARALDIFLTKEQTIPESRSSP